LVRTALVFVIIVAHGDAVLDALIFPNKSGACDRSILGWTAALRRIATIEVFGDGLEPLDRLALQAPIGQLLDAIGQPVFKEPAVIRRRFGIKELAPLLLERRYGQRL